VGVDGSLDLLAVRLERSGHRYDDADFDRIGSVRRGAYDKCSNRGGDVPGVRSFPHSLPPLLSVCW
jgi:hypothetical protein